MGEGRDGGERETGGKLVDWLFVESAEERERRNGQSLKMTNKITCSIF